ncbi:hypothetical protein R5H30_12710 [Sulfitobacter sp. D35]|uniref:hypothetical protein n=1 Tax=Sulfitobacter sp. D35 TaxID=3083252 RepID=UPI00296EFFFD|nr:hypothetical protein [Sulfitobacter sp. D35]MDW4498849.1 hypothetical protein [Sulfitobacter sp. D35]
MIRAKWFVRLAAVAGPAPACAHSAPPGLEGFYVGLVHPLSTPAQALLMLGLGFLVGGFPASKARAHLGVFSLALLVGVFAGGLLDRLELATYGAAVAACSLAALWPGRAMAPAVALAAAGGLLIGMASIPDAGARMDRVLSMTGSVIGASLGLLCLLGSVRFVRDRYTQSWVDIAFRIAAAWLGAISLVMLALRASLDG